MRVRSHQYYLVELVLYKKLDITFLTTNFFPIAQNNLAYHLGPVSLPGSDGSPLEKGHRIDTTKTFAAQPHDLLLFYFYSLSLF